MQHTQFVAVLLAAACLTTGSLADDVSPVEKVIQMIADLQAQVINEGKAEATTYDKFACFCKDMTNEKTEAITAGETQKEELTSTIGELSARREELDQQIADLTATIADLAKQMDEATKKREEEIAVYEKNDADLTGAIEALNGAIDALKSSKAGVEADASLLQTKIQKVQKTLSKALMMADALGFEVHSGTPAQQKALAALIQQPSVPTSDYDFQSGHIIEMLEDLLKDFITQKDDADAENVKVQAEHDQLMQSLTMQKKSAEDDLEQAKEDKGKVMDEIAQNQQDLTTCIATLRDDQAYLLDLTEKCEAKSKEWDQRSSMRQEELTALTQALAIIKGTVAEKTTEKTIRFVEKSAVVAPHNTTVQDDADAADDADDDEDDDEDDDSDDASFLQLQDSRSKLSQLVKSMSKKGDFLTATQTPREKAIALLRERGEKLHSTVLTSLANKMSKDVFAKIKKLIQELIERLLQEAANEASHKGWCDEAMGKAKQQRDLKAEKIKKLNTEMESQEAKRDKLAEEIKVLTAEIAELEDALAKATKQREEEKAENAATISEAQEGKDAVEMALDILKKFYAKAKHGKVEMIQQVPEGEMPDAGFEGAYKGSQAESGGIIGMLEVIQSDFDRTIRETTAAEKKAQQEFVEFERTTKVSLAQKTTAKETLETELSNVKAAHNENMDDLIATQDLFDKAIQELEELKPACVDTGMSYEERVARREQEIESLKEALCILDKEGPVQTEGC